MEEWRRRLWFLETWCVWVFSEDTDWPERVVRALTSWTQTSNSALWKKKNTRTVEFIIETQWTDSVVWLLSTQILSIIEGNEELLVIINSKLFPYMRDSFWYNYSEWGKRGNTLEVIHNWQLCRHGLWSRSCSSGGWRLCSSHWLLLPQSQGC